MNYKPCKIKRLYAVFLAFGGFYIFFDIFSTRATF